MSFDNPGDGVRCDHCNRTPRVAGNPEWCQDHLLRNRGETLCHRCFNRVIDAEIAAIVADIPVTFWSPDKVLVNREEAMTRYNHVQCPPDAHDRDPGTSIDDGQPVDENGDMLCRDCEQPLMHCATFQGYDHTDPSTPPCFLVRLDRE